MSRRNAKSREGDASPLSAMFESLGASVTRWAGSGWGFGLALGIVIVWAITGPIFKWSNTWQLVINTGTTIVTFLMVFLIQQTQNKDGLAIQIKLNELIAALDGASNRLIDVEDLSEHELKVLQKHFQRLAEMAKEDDNIAASHSIEEAESRHEWKRERRGATRKKSRSEP